MNYIQYSICILTAFAVSQSFGEQKLLGKLQSEKSSNNTAIIPVQKLEKDFYDWHQRHKDVVELIKKKPVDLVFIGDSITHMFGGLPKSRRGRGRKIWDKYYGHRNAINMGFGWDRTQNVLWRLKNGEFEGISPKVVVILIGTNNRAGTKNARQNTPTEIAEGITAICQTIHKKVPKCKILLLTILPRTGNHFIAPIQETNKLLTKLDKEEYITILNLYDKFADKGGLPKKELMRDSVHPNAKGYQMWAETMEPLLIKLLNDKAVMPTKTAADSGK